MEDLIHFVNFKFPTGDYLARDVRTALLESEERLVELEKQKNSVDSEFHRRLHLVKTAGERLITNVSQLKDRMTAVEKKLDELDGDQRLTERKAFLTAKVSEFKRLTVVKQYLLSLQTSLMLSQKLHSALDSKDLSAMLSLFKTLVESVQAIRPEATHLRSHGLDLVEKAFQKTLSALNAQLQDHYKRMNWPSTLIKSDKPDPTLWQPLFPTIHFILDIAAAYQPMNDRVFEQAMQIILDPLVVRFKYHFMGSRNTNRMDKPEWMHKHVLDLIKDHEAFLVFLIQPCLEKSLFSKLDAKTEFLRTFLSLIKRRMVKDIAAIMQDNNTSLFMHYAYETMKFDQRVLEHIIIYDETGTANEWEGCLTLLQKPLIVDYWVDLEKQVLLAKLEELLESPDVWEPAYKSVDDADALKVTKSVEFFTTLMETVIDKFSLLSDTTLKIRMLNEIVLELMNEYLRAMHKTATLYTTQFEAAGLFAAKRDLKESALMKCRFITSISVLVASYSEWEDLPFFLDLTSDAQPLFTPMIELYQDLSAQLENSLKGDLVAEFTSNLWSYEKKNDWSVSIGDKAVSFGLYEARKALDRLVQVLVDHLPRKQLHQILLQVTSDVDHHLLSRIVLKNTFSRDGVSQLELDVTACLWECEVKQVFSRPDNLFRRMKEAVMLLRLHPSGAPSQVNSQMGSRVTSVSNVAVSIGSNLNLASATMDRLEFSVKTFGVNKMPVTYSNLKKYFETHLSGKTELVESPGGRGMDDEHLVRVMQELGLSALSPHQVLAILNRRAK